MGIPYYFYVITQNHNGILRKDPPVNVSHFYLDYNGGVHPVCQRLMKRIESTTQSNGLTEAPADFEEQLCEESWKYMLGLSQVVKPTEIHIMLDGIAPVAKIQQQRKRRYLSVLRQKLLGKRSLWDTNAISPATAFMTRLNTTFREKCRRTFSAIPIHFNGSDEVGEGEHKIFERMASVSASASASGSPSPNSTQVIYGLDADLIMLSLLSHRPRVFLMREVPERNTVAKKAFGGGASAKPAEEPTLADGFHYLDIDALREGILKTLQKEYHWAITNETIADSYGEDACRWIENYVVCCFLLGNDFIPNIACLHLKHNGIYSVLSTFREAYEIVGHPLIQTLSCEPTTAPFSAEFLSHWLERLSRPEDTWMREMNDAYFKKRPMIQGEEDKIEFYPVMPEHKAPLAFEIHKMGEAMTKWRPMYYKHLFDSERQDPTPRMDACREYLKGMLWTYAYYKRHPKPYDWYYPFGYAPTLLDMFYQWNGNLRLLDTHWSQWQSKGHDGRSVSPMVQLLSILPKESHGLLPESLRRRIFTLGYLYPTAYPIETYLKTHLWECHPKLPILDFDVLRRYCEEALL